MGIIPRYSTPWPRVYPHVCLYTCLCIREGPGCTRAHPWAHSLEHGFVQVCVGNKGTSRQLTQCQMVFIQK